MRLRALFSSSTRAFSPPSANAVREALSSIVEPQQISGLSITDHRISFILETTASLAPTLEAACKSALSHLAAAEHIHIICTNPMNDTSMIDDRKPSLRGSARRSANVANEALHAPNAPLSSESQSFAHDNNEANPASLQEKLIAHPSSNHRSSAPLKPARYNTNPIPHVGRIIAIASGKGGVGKSSCAVLIAHALAARGQSVAIVDADIHGPSIPRMLGLSPTPPEVKDGLMIPPTAHGIMANSIGLVAGETAAIWRGPMVSKALVQLLRGTNWHSQLRPQLHEVRGVRGGGTPPENNQLLRGTNWEPQRSIIDDLMTDDRNKAFPNKNGAIIDPKEQQTKSSIIDHQLSDHRTTTLLIDLPPGTGDIQLSLMQAVPVSAAIIITTPQEVARIDAHKAATMFAKLNIPILGVIENMSYLTLPDGSQLTPFGAGGGHTLASSFGVPLLATLPLDPALGQALDEGKAPDAHYHTMLASALDTITALT